MKPAEDIKFYRHNPFYLIYHVARVVRSMIKARELIESGGVTVDDVVVTNTFHTFENGQYDIGIKLKAKIEYIKMEFLLDPGIPTTKDKQVTEEK